MSFISNQELTPFRVLLGIVANMPGHVYWKNKDGVYLGCNRDQAISLGFESSKEILGKTDFELPGDKERAAIFWENDKQVMETGQPLICEEETLINGRLTTVLTYKNPLDDEMGNVIGILGISLDITQLKQKERELAISKEKAEMASQAKSEFIQNISHDLRTPLTGLVTVSESYVNTLSDGDTLKDVFLLMRDSSNQLHQFLEEIIESVKLDNYTELPTELTSFSIEETIQRVIDLFRPAIVSKSLSCTIHPIEQTIDTKLMGYPDLVARILMNLIGNAIKFTDEGNITLSYGLVSRTQDQRTTHDLVLTVSDTGKGIPKSKHQEIFERLTRLSPSYKGIYEGKGLGLYITNKLIHLMNGHISVESDGIAGKGSSFTCHIPVKLSDEKLDSSDAPSCKIKNEGKERKAGYNILLADDSKVARYGAKITLESNVPNCKITEAETLQDIIKCIESNQYDLIITDLKFSDGDGKTAAEQIRKLTTSKNQTTPIVALTGDMSKETEENCMASGINKVLHKPLTLAVINRFVNDFLNG